MAGLNPVVIHICGASGSGKTVLGQKLKRKFGDKIVVKDLDDLRDEFIKHHYGNKRWTYIDEPAYQRYIDDFVSKNQGKPLILTGLNDNTRFGENKKLYYNTGAQYKYYIDIDDMTIVKQKCVRLFRDVPNNPGAMHDLEHNNAKFIKQITRAIKIECDAKSTIKMNNRWKRDYKKQGYKLMSRDDILKDVMKIIKKK